MPKEIERKFLVQDDRWKNADIRQRMEICQGYIVATKNATVRIRTADDQAWITVKAARSGIERAEFEYDIPIADAVEMLNTICMQPFIHKVRWVIGYEQMEWVIDEFTGANEGLTLAEVELEHADQSVILPPWLGMEVSEDARFYNSSLAKHPYASWSGDL